MSKEDTLESLRKQHPKEVAALPTNPFPDMLSVIPKRPADAPRDADLFGAEARGDGQSSDDGER